MNPRIGRYSTRKLIQLMMDQGGIEFNDQELFNQLIKQKVFTRREIQQYRRRLAIFWKHWWIDVSPLQKARRLLREGISVTSIHQNADVLARCHPVIELHEYYEEKIREEMEATGEWKMENVLYRCIESLELIAGMLNERFPAGVQESPA